MTNEPIDNAIKKITVQLKTGTLGNNAAEYWLHQVLTDLAQSVVHERDTVIPGYRVENKDAEITVLVTERGGR
jgi:hypothetical protein